MNAYQSGVDTPRSLSVHGEALDYARSESHAPSTYHGSPLLAPNTWAQSIIERSDRPYSPLVSQDATSFEPIARSLQDSAPDALREPAEVKDVVYHPHRYSNGSTSGFDDTFTYVLTRSGHSSSASGDKLYLDTALQRISPSRATQRPATAALPQTPDQSPRRMSSVRGPEASTTAVSESLIVDQYMDPPSSPKLVHRRPTEPATPVYDRNGIAQRRSALRDSVSSFGMLSAYDSDDSLVKQGPATRPARDVFAGTAADRSFMSLADQSSDQLLLPADYNSATLAGGRVDELLDADREWDEKTPMLHQHWSMRGFFNLGTLLLLVLCVLMLFLGYPVLHDVTVRRQQNSLVSPIDTPLNSLSELSRSLVDPDTPEEARTTINSHNNKTMRLVFSDEFNRDGRSFYPGEDPFWVAEDLNYWQTKNYEWYHPSSVTTANGSLVIKLSQHETNNLFFRGGMISTWNKFCFTGGKLEARLILPGRNNVSGLWPAVWAMGNLGRAGYGASTDGLWPYTYDSCDVGTLANQTYLASQGGGPLAAETSGRYVEEFGPSLSYLPGQRLSRCTCPDSTDHPGPKHPDGTWVGRSAPEIDLIEALGNNGPEEHGQVSMSLQLAPFDAAYNVTDPSGVTAMNTSTHSSMLNDYTGAVYQQAVSAKVNTSDAAYTLTENQWDTYAFEYAPGTTNDSYIKWFMSNEEVFRIKAHALTPNPKTEIGQRPIPQEPMYIIVNLGISASFNWINWDEISKDWNNDPSNYRMYVDYIRVYQDEDKITNDSLSCSPPDFPTAEYIEKHKEVYTNPLLTSWTEPPERGGYNHSFPPNVLLGQC